MLTISERAAIHVKTQLMNRDRGYGIKVGVKSSGCSGMSYILEFVDEINPNDLCFRTNGVNVYVDPLHLPFLEGLVMDWKREGLNEGFDFLNPNVRDECGCGKSFQI